MSESVRTVKLHLKPQQEDIESFRILTRQYVDACNMVSQYIFDHGFELNSNKVQAVVYTDIRRLYGLKSQLAISVIKTVIARYRAVQTQFAKRPWKCNDAGDVFCIPRTLEWLWKPIQFRRSQADLVRGRDYSFVNGGSILSLNTLKGRVKVAFDIPEYFQRYFVGTWKFGTGKLVELNGEWYFHVSVVGGCSEIMDESMFSHVVGLDRGLRFLYTSYDEKGKTVFMSGKKIMEKRRKFLETRAELQSKGTKSAKRVLKRISGRENRWMSDVNHQISKALVEQYGGNTLFVLEDLTGVGFAKENLGRGAESDYQLTSWAFYEFGMFLRYKAQEMASLVIEVSPAYTSQRCPKCGRIRKKNRNHKSHEYVCDCCGYCSNDDRVAAMNLYFLGTLYVSGDTNPRFGSRKA